MNEYLDKEWFARFNDLTGGWCVMPVDKNPSETRENPVADMCDAKTAIHIAKIHNGYLTASGKLRVLKYY